MAAPDPVTGKSPRKVFISYRREDTRGYAGRLYDSLSDRLGTGSVFMDVEGIAPGLDFVKVLNQTLRKADVVLALIGPRWLDAASDAGRRRLDDPADLVRIELETAIHRRTRVVPLLVGGARMPTASQLPATLAPLSLRNALELSDDRWRFDIGRLLETIVPPPQRLVERTAPTATSVVGPGLTPLIGRERELGAVETRLAGGARLITLLGPGGSGKTRVARELVARAQAQAGDAVFVDLVGVADPALVPAEIASALGVTETTELDAAAAVLAALHQRTTLLILDNLEELTEARDFLGRLLQAAPGLQLVATSRIPLGIPGEIEYQVPPLALPSGDSSAEVGASPAGRLFLERARAVGRLDEIDPATAQAIAELCRRLDGLPLALELAAARTRILPPAVVLRHLAERPTGLLAKPGTKPGSGDSRHASLDAVLDWSLDLLEPNEAAVLGAVAICPSGFDLAMAEALAPDCDVLGAIDVLASHGLLALRGDVDGEPWYQVLETIRAAAIARSPDDETSGRWGRLGAHLSDRVAGTLEAYYRVDNEAFQRLDPLLDAVRAVLDWADANDPALNLRIAGRFYTYWRVRGQHREGVLRLRTAIAANADPSTDLAIALIGLAVLERNIGGASEVHRISSQAAEIARVVGDDDREVLALEQLALVANAEDPAVRQRLLHLLPKMEHPISRFGCLNALASLEGVASGFESKTQFQLFQEAEDALAGTPYRMFQGVVAANVAQTYLYRDEAFEALGHITRALSMFEDAGPERLAWAHSLLAVAAARSGEIGSAAVSLRLALEEGASSAMGRGGEVIIAAVAVLTVFDAPLLAAKAWGSRDVMVDGTSDVDPDRMLGERLLAAALETADPVAFEKAIRAGEEAGVESVLQEVLAYLDVIEESRSGGRTLAT